MFQLDESLLASSLIWQPGEYILQVMCLQSHVDLGDVLPSPARDVMPECCTERQIRIHNRSLAAISDLANLTRTAQLTGRGSTGMSESILHRVQKNRMLLFTGSHHRLYTIDKLYQKKNKMLCCKHVTNQNFYF